MRGIHRSPILRAFGYLRPYRVYSALAILILAGVVGMDLLIPRLIQQIIDQGIAQKDLAVVVSASLTILGIAGLSALLFIGNTLLSVRVAQSYAADLRSALFHKIQAFSFPNLDHYPTGQLMVRLTSDVNQLQMAVMLTLRIFVRAPLMIVGSATLMILTSPSLATITLLLLPPIAVLALFFISKAQPIFMQVQKKLERLNQVLQENLAGIRLVKAFVRADYESKRFDDANIDLTNQSIKFTRLLSILFPSMLLVINLGVVVLVWFGGIQVITGSFTVGEILAFTNYLLATIFPVLMLSMIAAQFSAANASARRAFEILDTEPKIQDKLNPVKLDRVSGKVVFEDVCFSYEEGGSEKALTDINLIAEPGETVAILGATGSGKSTLVHLIPRFYDVIKGRVTLDGIDVREMSLESLRSKVGTVLQDTMLFSGTIRDNVCFGEPNASDEEILAAAKMAQAHDFISSFPQGYDTVVGQRGVNLSGGQKQRIAIARALLVKPSVLILDDSTSSVDVETEIKIEDALRQRLADRTTFIIAQRISTVLRANKIVVMDKGRIVQQGSHEDLIQTSPLYREIYDSQLGEGVVVNA